MRAEPGNRRPTSLSVLVEVLHERGRQKEKWGEQNNSDFEWTSILSEEVGEAAKEVNDLNFTSVADPAAEERLRAELVQVAAVAVAWVECIDRRSGADVAA